MLPAFLTTKIRWALAGLVLLAVLLPIGLRNSEATFVAATTNPNSLFSSAASFNTVAVSLTNPGTPLRSTVMLNAVATSDRGISSVVFQTSPAGANTWTTACSDNLTPYGCSWDTTAVADGLRDVRAVATDSGGYTRTDTVTNRRVDNTGPSATTTDPGTPLTGSVSVTGVGSDAGSGVASTTVQYRPSSGSWTDICTQASATATCAWNTASLADGLYDLRTVATDVAGNPGTPSAVVSSRRLDNIAPTATMTAPAANLTGSVTLQSTSADGANGTGVASVRYEYKPSASGTWVSTPACSSGSTPFSCSFNTTAVADGLYDFRAVATDGVNKTGTSTAVNSRRIDNAAPTANMGALAANLSGSVSLTSTPADSGSGVASVQYQYKLTSASTWTDACSSSTSPYSCSFNTNSVSDGLYDVRVVATDNVGITGASAAVSRRIDNTDPTVTMGALAANLTATVSLTSTPSDGGGIASVQYQYKLSSSGTWINTCSSSTSPYSCNFNTALFADGLYDFRAIATDMVNRTGTSAAVTSRRIDNTNPAVTMTAPAANLGGSVTLASNPTDAGSGVASVQYQYKLSSSGTWLDACPSASTPWTCAFNISGLADGFYDFRVIATDNVGRTATSAAVTGRRVDNTIPATVTLNAVGTPLSGNVNFSGTATDNAGGAGIASWKVQSSPAGTNTWTDLCTDAATPFGACTGNVDGFADGLYDFRALATDSSGNTRASTVQTNRRVDTDGPVASITSPANNARVSGTITMVAAASDPAGVQWVRFEVLIAGTWIAICTDNTATYTCAGDTTQVGDGTYQIRVVARDNLGHESTSASTTVFIDNAHPTATNVQTLNGGTQGRIDSGDTMTFTWSEPMAPASIMTGWGGSAQAIRVFVDNNVSGFNNDAIHIYHPTTNTRLNITGTYGLRLNANYVNNDVYLNGTMTMTGNNITVTVGSWISGAVNTGVTTSTGLNWYSSNAATDLAGNTATGNTANESGAADRDF
ncbi:MAG TPA: Ig-like domain-containing protein [Solirubrobacteraceae bacterium]|nr:Ig-like domain-containing protein [Solirubrobacteraceae bacterium]